MESQTNVQKKQIISRLLGYEKRRIDFIFEPSDLPCLRERSEFLLADSWELSREERILVRASLDIWDGSGHVFLWELLNGLSEQGLSRLIIALLEFCELEIKK